MTEERPAAGSGSDRLKQTAEDARDKIAERSGELKEDARAMAEQAKDSAVREAEQAKGRGAGRVRELSDALDRAASDLGEDSPSGTLIREAADGLGQMARSIESRSVGEMVEAAAGFGRRNPTVFLGGAMLAGFALSRFATASTPSARYGDPHDFDRHFDYDRPASPATSSVSRDPGTGPAHAARSAPGTADATGADDDRGRTDRPLTLKPSMQPGGGDRPSSSGTSSHHGEGGPATSPGTASAPTGQGDPYPSAGPAPATPKEDRT